MWEKTEEVVNLSESVPAGQFLKYWTEFDCLVAKASACACMKAPASCYDLDYLKQ